MVQFKTKINQINYQGVVIIVAVGCRIVIHVAIGRSLNVTKKSKCAALRLYEGRSGRNLEILPACNHFVGNCTLPPKNKMFFIVPFSADSLFVVPV